MLQHLPNKRRTHLLDAAAINALTHLMGKHQHEQNILFPDYELYSICNLFPTVLHAMGNREPEVMNQALQERADAATREQFQRMTSEGRVPRNAIVLLLDGLGFWHFLEAAAITGFLPEESAFVPISSSYPTVTTVALSCMWSWTPPAAHGVMGRPLYLKEIAALVDPKSGRVVGSNEVLPPETLLQHTALTNRHRFFEAMDCTVSMYAAESYSGFRRLVYGEQTQHQVLEDDIADINQVRLAQFAAKDGDEVARDLTLLKQALQNMSESKSKRNFAFVNLEAPNIVGHRHPVNSHLFLKDMCDLLRGIRTLVEESGLSDTMIFGVGDHGATPVAQPNNIDVSDFLATWAHAMSGPAVNHHRVLHLFVQPEYREQVQKAVEAAYGPLVKCVAKDEALYAGIYGTANNGNDYAGRCGDLVVFNLGAGLFWTADDPAYKRAKMSDHGGLSVEELLVPCFAFHAR